MLGLLILVVLIGGAVSERPKCGSCPTIAPEYIDVNRMTGKWVEWKSSVNTQDDTASCGNFNFLPPAPNGDIVLTFSAISSLIESNSTLVGVAKIDYNKITVDFHLPILGVIKNMTYYIIEADYDSYFIVWSCVNYGKNHIPTVYVQVRNPEAACGIDRKIEKALRKRGLSVPKMIKENRTDCPCGNK